jgi:hypothetical protein
MIDVKVTAIMTAPRYEATWARNIIEAALKDAGIPFVVSGGVFYGQCMQRMLEDAIEAGVEVAVTIDFDSIFTGEDVTTLISHLMADDEISALASLQSRRGMPYPLFTAGDSTQIEFDGTPMEVTTAHFGLTALRLSDVSRMEKPWFHQKPSPDGTWTNGTKVDSDIWFWKRLRDSGYKVFIDPTVSIGHLEEVVAYFDENGVHRYIYPNEWYLENLTDVRESNPIDDAASLAE